jgi:hypothetical protein
MVKRFDAFSGLASKRENFPLGLLQAEFLTCPDLLLPVTGQGGTCVCCD